MNEATKIADTKLAASTKAAIKEHFPYAVTLGDLKQCISDDPTALDCFTPRTVDIIMNILDFNDYDSPAVKQDTPTDTAAFDYSAVDEDTANYLRKATARIANSYADIGAVLAEAQERLANNKNGVFEKWYTFLGMKKSTVHDYIHIHKKRQELLISSEFRTISENSLEVFDSLPKTLQIDISSPSAPAEAVNAVLSGDITTHKDFIAMKKQLEETQEENERLTEKNRFLSMDYTHEKERNERMLDELKEFREKSDALALELKEARSEAREVIMTDPTESSEYKKIAAEKQRLTREKIELEEKLHKAWGDLNTEEFDRRIAEISQKFSNSAAEQIARDRQASAELLRQRTEGMQEIIDGLEEKLRQLEKQPLMGYFLPASIEDYSGICGLLKGTKYEKIMYAAKLIKI